MTQDSDKTWQSLYGSTIEHDELLMPNDPLPFVEDIVNNLIEEGCCSVLDAACGEGRNSQRFVDEFPEVHGCDISSEALETCSFRCDDAISVQEANVLDLPYEDMTFDATLMLDALTHLREVELAIRELARVTANGGYVIFNMPVEGDDAAETGELYHRYGILDEYRYSMDGPEVVYMFVNNVDQFIVFLESLGFSVDQIERYKWRDPPHPEYRKRKHSHENLLLFTRRNATLRGDMA